MEERERLKLLHAKLHKIGHYSKISENAYEVKLKELYSPTHRSDTPHEVEIKELEFEIDELFAGLSAHTIYH